MFTCTIHLPVATCTVGSPLNLMTLNALANGTAQESHMMTQNGYQVDVSQHDGTAVDSFDWKVKATRAPNGSWVIISQQAIGQNIELGSWTLEKFKQVEQCNFVNKVIILEMFFDYYESFECSKVL